MTLKAPNFLAYGAAFVSGGAYGGPPMGRKNRKTQDETAKFFFGRYAPETHTFVNRANWGYFTATSASRLGFTINTHPFTICK